MAIFGPFMRDELTRAERERRPISTTTCEFCKETIIVEMMSDTERWFKPYDLLRSHFERECVETIGVLFETAMNELRLHSNNGSHNI